MESEGYPFYPISSVSKGPVHSKVTLLRIAYK